MSDKNIDKDIEEKIILLKDFIEGNFKRDKIEHYKGSYKMGFFYYSDIKDAIENVLEELKTYKRIANMNLKDSEEFNKNMCEHRCPIKSDYEEVKQNSETWKKIAEILAERTGDYGIIPKCEKCSYEDSHECIDCVIDWARKEVEKDV